MFADKVFIMLLHGLRFARCQILIRARNALAFFTLILLTLQYGSNIFVCSKQKEGMDIRIHLRKTFIITTSQKSVGKRSGRRVASCSNK